MTRMKGLKDKEGNDEYVSLNPLILDFLVRRKGYGENMQSLNPLILDFLVRESHKSSWP